MSESHFSVITPKKGSRSPQTNRLATDKPDNERREERRDTNEAPARRPSPATSPGKGKADRPKAEGQTTTGQTPNETTTTRKHPGYCLNAAGVKGGDGVWGVPRYKKQSNIFIATCIALDTRSHNRKAGVASVANERFLGDGRGHPQRG